MARVAIEFDSNQIFLATMQTASRRWMLKHVACIQTGGSISEITEALRAKIDDVGLAKADTCVVVRRGDVELRLLEVPPAPQNELPGMVRFLAKNEFASLNDNWSLDFVQVSGDASTPGQVMAAGFSPEAKTRIKKIVEGAGLRLRNIEFRPYAIAQYLGDQLNKEGPTAVVEPMGDQAEIMVMLGKSIIAVRKFKLVGDNRSRQLEREIKRTFAAKSASLGGQPLANLLLIGKSDQLESIGDTLSKSLNVKYQVIDPERDRVYGGEIKKVNQPNRVVALIGALSQSKTIETIDFMNPRKPIVEKRDYSRWKMYGWVATAALMLMFAFGWWTLSKQSQEIQEMRDTLASIAAKNQGDGDSRPAVEDTLKEVGAIDQWFTSATNWQENLLTYSQHALTADDAIVDRLEGRMKAKTNTISIGIENRAADNAAEAALVRELSKAFDVIPGKSELVDDDEYKAQSNLTVAKQIDAVDKIKQIDGQAKEFLNAMRKANATAANNQTQNN